ncbi:hypothetical protein D7I39_20925 [Allopusillimonas ginsengisoli]|nr:hypothetical protein D7I39_20925 [Allopusillimonas ginsengisoli]
MSEQTLSVLAVYQSYLGKGQLAYQYSIQADRPVFYPREICPYTGTGPLEWRVSKGMGTVYSVTTINAKNTEPYNVSLIDCDEGFRLMSRVEGVVPDQVKIGARVQFLRAIDDEGEFYPVFKLAETL